MSQASSPPASVVAKQVLPPPHAVQVAEELLAELLQVRVPYGEGILQVRVPDGEGILQVCLYKREVKGGSV